VAVNERISMDCLDELVERHMAFLIRTVSNTTGRYVSVEHDDAFSIGLSAFAEAVERYEPERGGFLPFAGLVIQSRLRTYMEKERRQEGTVSLDALREAGQEAAAPEAEEENGLHEEIVQLQSELALFDLTLEVLADEAPRHQDTRDRALEIAERSSQDAVTVEETYRKRRLPVRRVARLCDTTEKIVKGSRHFILTAMLIFVKKFPQLLHWVQSGRRR
jgi:RNA polymerase sigma factor